MSGTTETPDAERRQRENINRDGLLDLFGGVMLVLAVGLGALSQSVAGSPGMLAGMAPLFPAFFFEPARRRWTYPRLGCPDYKPTKEIMFALVAMTISAVLGLVVFLLTALARVDVVRPFFEHAPLWAALGGTALCAVLVWWYGSGRFLAYVAVAVIAVVAGQLLTEHMLARMAILTGAVGAAMTVCGVVLFLRFRRAFPSAGAAARANQGPDKAV